MAELVSRISTDADGMSELVDTIAKAFGAETLVPTPIQS